MDEPVKVLVVDDEAPIRRLFKTFLEELGYRVSVASDGAAGLEQFALETPDVVLTDLTMPGMDGWGLLASLTGIDPRVPIIVVSGTGNIRDVAAAIRKGAWDYVMKPVNEAVELDIVLRRTLEKARLLEENRRYQQFLEQTVLERTRELLASEDRLRRLAAHRQKEIEEERARIAREIHDELGQQLTVLKMDLAWLRKKTPAGSPALGAKIDAMIGDVEATHRVVEQIISELRPQILDDLGLVPALEWLSKGFGERTGLKVVLSAGAGSVEAGRDAATAAYRIVQEALTNVSRHAAAKTVWIFLRGAADGLTLRVEDDGRGIDAAAVDKKGTHGLIGIQERVFLMGGTVEIGPRPAGGTALSVRIPSARDAGDAGRG